MPPPVVRAPLPAPGAAGVLGQTARKGRSHAAERSRRSSRAPDPGPGVLGPRRLRRAGPRRGGRADRAAAPALRRAQRPDRPARRRRLRRRQRLRRAVRDADRRAARGRRPALHPLPHHGAVLADAPGAAHRAQPPLGWHGRHHRDRDRGARVQLDPPEHGGAARRDAQAQRLLDGAVRQVPRGSGLGDEPARPLRRLAHRRRRVRVLLRLHRRRGAPVPPGDLRGHGPRRAGHDARRGLPLHGRHDGQGDRLGAPAEGAHARQAVLRLLRSRRHARPSPRRPTGRRAARPRGARRHARLLRRGRQPGVGRGNAPARSTR